MSESFRPTNGTVAAAVFSPTIHRNSISTTRASATSASSLSMSIVPALRTGLS